MPKVIGVRFRTSPRMYYFAPTEGEEYEKGTSVVVETQRGVELATVILPITEVTEDKIVAPLKGVMRIATEADLQTVHGADAQKQDIIATAKQKVAARGLDMKIVDCEFTVDHSKLVLYFTAEQRVDFRELVRDLASAFHMRIDLRQIGAREECKLIGSLGTCGMPCCCGRFESDSEHVSIKMAKCQNLALTPNKINGMCGRLLCCLSYENKTYEDVAKRAPKVGSRVGLPDGRRGTVVSVTPLTEKVRVRVGDEDNFEFTEVSLGELKFEKGDKGEKGEKGEKTGKSVNPAQDGKAAQSDGAAQPQSDKKNQKNKNNNQKNNNRQNNKGGEHAEGNVGNSQNQDNNNQSGGKNNKKKKHRNHRKSGGKPQGGGGQSGSGQNNQG